MIASIVLLASLTITPSGYVLQTIADDQLVRMAEHEFEWGMKFTHDGAKARPRFREAARMYDELWHRGLHDPSLALNRASARRLAGDLPGAIVALNEGLGAARWSRPLQVALEDARSAVAYPVHGDLAVQCRPVPTATIGTRMSPFEARLVAAVCWLLVCGGIARFAMNRAGWWLAFAGVWLAALVLLAGLWIQDERVHARATHHPLVVLANDVYLRKGNSEAFPPRLEGAARLPRGVEARELTRRGGWIQVQLAGGVIGWIPESSALLADAR
jgi:hypothetical protein